LLRAVLKRPADARADFEAAQALLEGLVREFPGLPAPRAALGRTCAGLGRLARAEQDAAGASAWFTKAGDALRRAADLAPDDAWNRRWLAEVEAGQAVR
jgi:hypothetical protein